MKTKYEKGRSCKQMCCHKKGRNWNEPIPDQIVERKIIRSTLNASCKQCVATKKVKVEIWQLPMTMIGLPITDKIVERKNIGSMQVASKCVATKKVKVKIWQLPMTMMGLPITDKIVERKSIGSTLNAQQFNLLLQ